jgi:hypothetical protein
MLRSAVRATKVAPRGERERARAHRPVGPPPRSALGHLAQLAGRRVLALGEAVDPVVEHQDGHVHVAPQHVQQMIAADAAAVAVTGDDEDLELGPRQLETGGDRGSPAVDGVEPVRVHVVREAARAADPGDEHDVLPRDAEVGHHLLHRAQDRVVPAAGAPAHVLVGFELLLGVLRQRSRRPHYGPHCSLQQLVDGFEISWLAAEAAAVEAQRVDQVLRPGIQHELPAVDLGTSTRRYWRRMAEVRGSGLDGAGAPGRPPCPRPAPLDPQR